MGVIHRRIPGKWDWEGVELVTYDKPTVRGVSKRVLIGPKDGAQGFSMRYFEVQPGGNSAFADATWLDRHLIKASLPEQSLDLGGIPKRERRQARRFWRNELRKPLSEREVRWIFF